MNVLKSEIERLINEKDQCFRELEKLKTNLLNEQAKTESLTQKLLNLRNVEEANKQLNEKIHSLETQIRELRDAFDETIERKDDLDEKIEKIKMIIMQTEKEYDGVFLAQSGNKVLKRGLEQIKEVIK